MQHALCSVLLILTEPFRILAWVEPQGRDVCLADAFQHSCRSSSLLQGMTQKLRVTEKVESHDDNHMLPEVAIRKSDALHQDLPQATMQPLQVKKDNVLQRISLQPMSNMQLHVHSLLNVTNAANTSNPANTSGFSASETVDSGSLQSLNGTTSVKQLVLLLTGLQRHVSSISHGTKLNPVAATMTMLLGVLLLTAFFMVVRPSATTDFDPKRDQALSESRPSSVYKPPRHSHTATTMAPLILHSQPAPRTYSLMSGFIPQNEESRDIFCSELVVPDGSECVLMVPILPQTIFDVIQENSVFPVNDMEGSTCLCIRLQSFTVLGEGLRVATPGLRERIMLMAANSPQRILAHCERHGLSFHVHCHDDELFARLSRDETGAYSLVGRSGPIMRFTGLTSDCSVRVANPEGRVLAYIEKGDVSHFKLRVGPLVDVGLVLCGLLALSRMEAERLSIRPSTITRPSTGTRASTIASQLPTAS